MTASSPLPPEVLKTLRSWFRTIAAVAAVATLALPGAANAGLTEVIHSYVDPTHTIEVHVTDEQGHALPGATVWTFESPVRKDTGQSLDTATVERMARRYARIDDFLANWDLPGGVRRRAGPDGVLRYSLDEGNRDDLPQLFVALKRGHHPHAIAGRSLPNRTVSYEIRLTRDTDAVVSPRMVRFDAWMAEAERVPTADTTVAMQRRRLRTLEADLRDLASEMEAAGENDDAAAVYLALADFPVILTPEEDGAAGYSHGGPRSEADRRHAIAIARHVPMLLIEQEFRARGYPDGTIRDATAGAAFLAVFENTARGDIADQLAPHLWDVAFAQYVRFRPPSQACAVLQRRWRFDPALHSPRDWRFYLDRLKRAAASEPSFDCVLDGLIWPPAK